MTPLLPLSILSHDGNDLDILHINFHLTQVHPLLIADIFLLYNQECAMDFCTNGFGIVHTILLFSVQRKRLIFLYTQVDMLGNLRSLLPRLNLLDLNRAIIAILGKYILHQHLVLVYPTILPQIGGIDDTDLLVACRGGTSVQYRTTL